MKINFVKGIKKIARNSTFLTLFATTFGVLLAFYLDSLNTNSEHIKLKQQLLANVVQELESNQTYLNGSNRNESIILLLKKIKSFDPLLKGEIEASRRTMDSILREVPSVTILDSIERPSTANIYIVEYNFVFHLTSLSEIAWEATKISHITQDISYPCLEPLISVYSFQELFQTEERKLLDHKISGQWMEMLRALVVTNGIKAQLLSLYDETLHKLKNCDSN